MEQVPQHVDVRRKALKDREELRYGGGRQATRGGRQLVQAASQAVDRALAQGSVQVLDDRNVGGVENELRLAEGVCVDGGAGRARVRDGSLCWFCRSNR